MAVRGRPRKNNKSEETQPFEDIQAEEVKVEETPEQNEDVEQDIVPIEDMEGTQGDFNPFGESVYEREYATPKVATGIVDDLAEPVFEQKNPFEERMRQENEEQPHPFADGNPALNDMDFQDKKIACESLVDTALDTYEQLHALGQNYVQVDEAEMIQKQQEGEIDLSMEIPVDEQGTTMSVMDFVEQYNQQSKEALQYDKEFGYKVRPAMLRVFMKKGWGMTDEQFLAYSFGKDILTKSAIVFSLKKTMNNTFDLLKKSYEQNEEMMKGGGGKEEEYEDEYEDEDDAESYEQEEMDNNEEPQVEYVDSIEPIIVQDSIPKKNEDAFTQKMDINMPEKPDGSMSEHPKEVRDAIIKGRKEEEKAKTESPKKPKKRGKNKKK